MLRYPSDRGCKMPGGIRDTGGSQTGSQWESDPTNSVVTTLLLPLLSLSFPGD